MMQAIKLNYNQKHLLRLIADGVDDTGYATVGAAVFPILEREVPPELVELERDFEDGPGRAKLTPTGGNLIDAMRWL